MTEIDALPGRTGDDRSGVTEPIDKLLARMREAARPVRARTDVSLLMRETTTEYTYLIPPGDIVRALDELDRLRARVAELEAQLNRKCAGCGEMCAKYGETPHGDVCIECIDSALRTPLDAARKLLAPMVDAARRAGGIRMDLATSNSFRRFVDEDHGEVLGGTVGRDRWPDLYAAPGVLDHIATTNPAAILALAEALGMGGES